MTRKTFALLLCCVAPLVAHDKSRGSNSPSIINADERGDLSAHTQTLAASPGGVDYKLAFWLRANAGTSTTKNNVALNTWIDQSRHGNSASKVKAAAAYRANQINGYPAIDFGARSQAAMTMANSASLNSDSDYAAKSFLLCVRTGEEVSSRQVLYEQGGAGRGINLYIEAGAIYFGAWNTSNNGPGSPWGFASVNAAIKARQVYMISCTYEGNATLTGALALYLNGKLMGTASQVGILYSHTGNIGIGAMNNAAHFASGSATGSGFHFTGQLAELIGYNQGLSHEDRQRVESYLALKYGLTLDQSTPRDYVSSDFEVIYPASTTHQSYNRNIAGIGRDDDSARDQKKSKALGGSGNVTMLRNEAFSEDESFLTWGDNGAAASLSASFEGGNNNRLARIWRVSERGAVDTVAVRLPIKVATGLSHLLVSSDENFPAQATAKIALCTTGGNYEAGFDFSDGQYFTFASECPSLQAYTLVYQLDIPAIPTNFNQAPVPYSIDNRASITFPFDRIAYKLELADANGRQFVCASMEAFTNDVNKIGVPTVSSGAFFHQRATNLEVASDAPGIVTGQNLSTGHVEFWPNNYAPGNSGLVPNASWSLYDFGDDPASPSHGYGSMQIHNYDIDGEGPGAQGQTLFALNAWGNSGEAMDLGIGDAPIGHPDWTFAHNAASYSLRRLQIFVRPAALALTTAPQPLHFYARNRATNKAKVRIAGEVIRAGIEEVMVKVYREGVLTATLTQPVSANATFVLEPEITAELANYDLELLVRSGNAIESVRRFEDIVAGDVYLIQGQSNAVAQRFNGSANANQNSFIRSFGTSDTSGVAATADLSWHIAEGDSRYRSGSIGQWGLRTSRLLLDAYHVPIAVLNGGHMGKGIDWFQRNDAAPDTLTTNYGRLLFRAKRAEIASAVRAMFWFQGESDGAAAQAHENGFFALYHDWKTDYPNLEKIYVTQVRAGCGNPSLDLRDRQRRFADAHGDIAVMSTNGLDGHDGCHYAFTEGYEKLGENLFRLAGRDLYGATDTLNIAPPNIAAAYFSNESKSAITLEMRNASDALIWEAGAENDFKIEGANVAATSGAISGNRIVLTLSGEAASATGISYLGHSGPGPWVTNANGVGLLSFYNVPIARPAASGPGGVAEGLMLWLKAEVGVVQDSGKVNAWVDQSSNGYVFTAIGAGSARPDWQAEFMNQQPAISIGASQHGLAAPAQFDRAVSDYTFIAVLQQTGGDYFIDNLNTVRFKLNNGPLGLYRQNDYRLLGFSTSDAVLQTWRFKDGANPETTVFRQGAMIASDSAYAPMTLTNNFRIGSRYSLEDFSNFEGKVAELIVYARALSEEERQQVETYLAAKFGFTLNQNAASSPKGLDDGFASNRYEAEQPKTFSLSPNYPNPFNLQTTIAYALPQAAHVQVSLFNSAGQLVRRLVDARQTPGYKTIRWDGKDHRGAEAGSGVYILRMKAGGFVQTRKMILQK
jgi:hypothetical protein